MFGWLLRLGFNEVHTPEALFTTVVAGHRQKLGKVFFLTLHIGVEQAHISFASAPEYIVGAAEGDGGIDCIFDLHTRVSRGGKIGIGGRAIHIARIGEDVGRTPEELDAGGPLAGLHRWNQRSKALLDFEDGTIANDIGVVEAIEGGAEFAREFKGGVEARKIAAL